MDEVVTTIYDFFNRKFFSLPKLMMLPGIMMRQPMLVAQITPFIFGSDFVNAKILESTRRTPWKYNRFEQRLNPLTWKTRTYCNGVEPEQHHLHSEGGRNLLWASNKRFSWKPFWQERRDSTMVWRWMGSCLGEARCQLDPSIGIRIVRDCRRIE